MSPKGPTVGDVYRRDLLRTQATYRVLGVHDDHVEVEVIEAPGLQPGFHVKLTLAALETMEREEEASPRTTQPARTHTSRHATSPRLTGA